MHDQLIQRFLSRIKPFQRLQPLLPLSCLNLPILSNTDKTTNIVLLVGVFPPFTRFRGFQIPTKQPTLPFLSVFSLHSPALDASKYRQNNQYYPSCRYSPSIYPLPTLPNTDKTTNIAFLVGIFPPFTRSRCFQIPTKQPIQAFLSVFIISEPPPGFTKIHRAIKKPGTAHCHQQCNSSRFPIITIC